MRCETEYAQTTADLDLGSWTIPAGCVAGVAASWKGLVGDKVVVDLNVRWRKGQTLDPDWKIEQGGWVIQVEGRPSVTLNVGFLPPPDFEAETIADFMVLGHIMTAMPAINAIPAVVAAAPGIVTYLDLPLTLPRGNVPLAVARSADPGCRAAIDGDDRTGDEAGPIRRQERCQLGHLLGLTGPLQCRGFEELWEPGPRTGATGQSMLYEAGADGIGADALRPVLDRG